MKNKVFLVIECVLYAALIGTMVSLINYTKNYGFYIFFIFSLLFNNFLVLWFDRKEKHFWIRNIIFNLFFGFCVFINTGYIKSFISGALTPGFFLEYVLYYLGEYLLTGNWLLPFIFNSIDKIREKKEDEKAYYDSVKVVQVEGKKNRNKEDFLENIGKLLSFPDYYSGDLDSLDECICDLQWIPERKIVIVLKNSDFFLLEETAESKVRFFQVMKNAIQFWKEGGYKNLELEEKKELVVMKDI